MSAGVEPDPFDVASESPLQRDQWDRPIILRPDVEGCMDNVRYCRVGHGHGHYARASTFSGWLDDGYGLANWKVRHATLAVARASESTRAMLAGCHYPRKGDPCPLLDEFIDVALTEAKRDERDLELADLGSAIHRFTEEDSPPHAPELLKPDIEAYHAEIRRRGWREIGTELFVVNDALRVAGTLDHLYELPDGRVIVGDKKTGKIHPLSHAIQLVAYAYGEIYDPATGARSPLGADLAVATIVHIPLGSGRCHMIPIDIHATLVEAHRARAVYESRRTQERLLLPLDVLD